MAIHKISPTRFNALCYVRDASWLMAFGMEELAWYEAFEKKLLAIVIKDYEESYSYIILGRDKRKLFRWIDGPAITFKNQRAATSALLKALKKFKDDGQEIYPQDDEEEPPNEILVPMVAEGSLHPQFKALIGRNGYSGAKELIREAAYAFNDVDGNYIKDFQTTGFDSRLWELYLHLYFVNSGFKINREFAAPDFLVSWLEDEVALEAVSVNSSVNFDVKHPPLTKADAFLLNRDYMPIKFGSPLTTKLNKLHKGKRYWELDHVVGKPLVIAIHDYHLKADESSLGSMTWSREGLAHYLYGIRMKGVVDGEDVNLELNQTEHGVEPVYEEVKTHDWNGKSIPSYFFKLPDSENISAVLFSNNATLGTFTRMGKLAGFGDSRIKILRMGDKYDPNPHATMAIPFVSNLDDPTYEESWADTLVMFHNPHAKIPLDPNIFGDISHAFFWPEDRMVTYRTKPYDVLKSATVIVAPK